MILIIMEKLFIYTFNKNLKINNNFIYDCQTNLNIHQLILLHGINIY